jgi:hypothetical protein
MLGSVASPGVESGNARLLRQPPPVPAARNSETGTSLIDIVVQYFDSCPHWTIADNRLRKIIRDHRLDVALRYQAIETPEEAEEHKFTGSPTLLINGRDPWATRFLRVGLGCRTYLTEAGPAGSPSSDQLGAALGLRKRERG